MANKVNLTSYVSEGKKVITASVQRTYENPNRAIAETKVTTNEDDKHNHRDWVYWGPTNNYPQEVLQDLRKSSLVKRIFNDLANIHVGSDILYGTYEVQENGTRLFVPAYSQEIEDFIFENDAFEVQKELVLDLETFYNAFPEFIWNKAGTKIVQYGRVKAAYCRISKPQNNRSKFVYVSSRWPNPSKEHYSRIAIDNGSGNNLKKFCLPLSYPSMDLGSRYSRPHWDSVRENGWLDIAANVPKILNIIYANQAVIKYRIDIYDKYYENVYSDWNEVSAKVQQERKDNLEDELTEFLSDMENYGKSLITYYPTNDAGEKLAGITIEAVDNKRLSKDGNFLVDASAANSEICFATGMPVVLSGVGVPGARSSQGSGSTIREELWKMQALMAPNRNISLKPLRLISHLNKWRINGKRVVWKYGDTSTLQTLNKNPNGKEPAVLGD
jgi:hypothetical protein